MYNFVQFSSVSHVWLFVTPWTTALQASLLVTNSWIYSNSCPSSQWCHPTISSSVIPFFSRLQSFPASGSFQMSQLFISGDQSIGVSLSTSVLQMNIQVWFPLGWIGWMSLQSKGLSRVFSNTTVCRISKIISCLGPIFMLCSELPADLSFQSEPSQCCSADMTVYI